MHTQVVTMTNKIKKRNNKRNNTGIPESRIFNFSSIENQAKTRFA